MNDYNIIQSSFPENIAVSVATPDDLSSIQLLLLETAKWLKNKGLTQWSALLEGNDVHNTSDAISNGNVFLFKHEEKLVGMTIVFTKATTWDQEIWSDRILERGIYLHRLAISRDFAGKSLGSLIMKWIEEGIVFDRKKYIRLDCMAGNSTLNSFYRSQGYHFQGEKNGYNRYEKLLGNKET